MSQPSRTPPYAAPPDYADDDALVRLVDAARAICRAPHSGTDPIVIRVPRQDLAALQQAVADFTGKHPHESMKGGSS